MHAALASLREVLRVVTRFSVPAQAENSAPKKMSSRSVTSFSFVSLSWLNGCARGGQRPGREDQRVRQGVMPGSGASPRATRTTRSGSSAASSGPRPNRRDMRSAAPRKKLEGDSPRAAPMIRFERASSRRPDARPRRPDSTTPPRLDHAAQSCIGHHMVVTLRSAKCPRESAKRRVRTRTTGQCFCRSARV